jgi:hypothetical protein
MTTRSDAELKEVADAIVEYVAEVESRPEITQGHYGQYMNMLSTVCGEDRVSMRRLAQTLIGAGANPVGVNAALRIILGE